MVTNNKVLTVSYGTFSCTLEGFDDSFDTMKSIAEYFRDLASDDRYFGAEPPTPDAEMLARIAEREIARRVEASENQGTIVLRAADADGPATAPTAAPAAAPAAAEVEAPAAPVVKEAPVAETPEAPEQIEETVVEPVIETKVEAEVEQVVEPVAADDVDAPLEAEAEELPVAAVDNSPEESPEESVAAKLQRIRAVVSRNTEATETPAVAEYSEDQHADEAQVYDIEEPVEDTAEAPADEPNDEPDQTLAVNFDSLTADTDTLPEYSTEEVVEDIAEAVADDVEPDDLEAEIAEVEVEETAEDIKIEVSEAQAEAAEDDFGAILAAVRDAEDSIPAEVADALAETDLSQLTDDAELELSADDIAEDEAAEQVNEKLEMPEPSVEVDFDETEDAIAEDEADFAEEAPETVAEDPAEVASEDTAEAVPAQPVRPIRPVRVVKVKRADLEVQQAQEAQPEAQTEFQAEFQPDFQPEPVAEAAPVAPAAPVDDSALSAEEEADLLRELAEVEAEFAEEDEVLEPGEVRSIFAEEAEEADVSRLMDKTASEMDNPEGSHRRNAIAHLRAAVQATRAETDAGSSLPKETGDTASYRNDLESVVRPNRPGAGDTRPAPLKLVAAQRVDAPETSAEDQVEAAPEQPVEPADQTAAPVRPVRPIRPRRPVVAASNDAAPANAAAYGSFEDYVEAMGAEELPDLLEAAASYLSYVKGVEQFSRPQLMRKARQIEAVAFSREDGLRSFGQLLRDGKIEKLQGGRFTVSEHIGFKPDQRAAG